jgi:hypothetical protein
MKWKYISNVGLWVGTMTMLLGSAVLAQAAPPSAKAGDEPQKAARLLRDIKADAMQVRSAATRLESLTKSSSAKWLDYDRQWNEIKPPVEDMQIKLARLETMQAAISPAERAKLDQSKLLVPEIQTRTRELRTLLDKSGVQTNDAKFKAYARSLRTEAGKLENTAPAS